MTDNSWDIWHLSETDKKTLKHSRVLLSMSGGKDSTACALLLEKHNIKFECVFMDTGWEHPALYQYIKDILEPRFGKVTFLKSEKYPEGMAQLVRERAMFPNRRARFCTDELKIIPYRNFVKSIEEPVVSVIGIRRQESQSRSKAKRWEYNKEFDCDVFRPIVKHSFEHIIEMHKAANMAPNPLYLQGAQRVGCFPCIFSRKEEVLQMAKIWPDRVEEIAQLEQEVTAKVREKRETIEKKKTQELLKWRVAFLLMNNHNKLIDGKIYRWGEWLKHMKGQAFEFELDHEFVQKTFKEIDAGRHKKKIRQEFLNNSKMTFFGNRKGTVGKADIKTVVLWAKTGKNGYQFEMFDESAQDGCVRWGMCESPLADAELVKIAEPKSRD